MCIRKSSKWFLTLIMYILFQVIAFNPIYVEAKDQLSTITSEKEMKIHAIYLGDGKGERGDAVLLESRGKYLLMDTGTKQSVKYILKYLKDTIKGDIHLDIYISHMHADHYGGLEELATNKEITIDTVYLPDRKYGKYIKENGKIVEFTHIWNIHSKVAFWAYVGTGKAPVYLKVTDNFKVGDAKVEIIGPVGDHLKNFEVINNESLKVGHDKTGIYGRYLNNYSLVAMVTCGSKKYLTAGDIEGQVKKLKNPVKREENYLIRKYGKKLKADIMKLSHHGIYPANSSEFMSKVQPTYSFASNNNSNNSKTAWKNATDYGICFLLGREQENIIFHVKGNNIFLYKQSTQFKLQNLVELKGYDSMYRISHYFIDSKTGNLIKGLKKIAGNTYYFSESGYMVKGFQKIGDATYYFDSNGKMLVNKKKGKYKFNSKGELINVPLVRIDAKKINAISNKKNELIVKWKAAKGADGYVIQYATNKKFENYKRIEVKGNKSTQVIIKELKGSNYYIRVTGYKKLGNVKVYGPKAEYKDLRRNTLLNIKIKK